MWRYFLIILATITFTQTSFAISRPPKSVTRILPSFQQISVNGNIKLNITVTPKNPELRIFTTKSQAKCITTDINKGMLYINRLAFKLCPKDPQILININMPDLKAIMTHNQSYTNVRSIHSPIFLAYISGQSRLFLNGATHSINIIANDESSLDASHLKIKSALIKSSGNSQTTINTANNLYVHASGNAQINYQNIPKHIFKSLTGNSSLSQES